MTTEYFFDVFCDEFALLKSLKSSLNRKGNSMSSHSFKDKKVVLPSATVVVERLCFHMRLTVHRGHVWQRGGVGVHGEGGGGHVWQERRPLQRTVRILLQCILVFGWFSIT